MSDSPMTKSNAGATPGRWALRLGLGCLALALVPFVLKAFAAWRNDGEIRVVVLSFFQAVADGRPAEALTHFSDRFRSALRDHVRASAGLSGVVTDEVQIHVLSVDQQTDRAASAQVSISKQGFSLKPTVRLQRTKDSTWKIVRIDDVDVDPHWIRIQAHEAGEQLAEEFSEKLDAPRVE